MLPAVAKIVGVMDRGTDLPDDRETHRAFIFDGGHPHEPAFGIREPKAPLANGKFVTVAAVPSHRGLQDIVQLRKNHVR